MSHTSISRRLGLFVVAAVVALSGLAFAVWAHADTTTPVPPPPGRPGEPSGPPGGPGGRGPFLAIAWSPDNGDHGWANNQPTDPAARAAAIGYCQRFGGDQCQVVVVTKECGALFAAAPDTTPDHKWGPANVGTGPTPDAAQAVATDPSKVYETGDPLIIRCATGDAGQG
jgi:hypothetical protein